MEDQEEAREFVESHGLGGGPSEWVHDLQSELGEVSKEILRATDYGERPPEFDDDIEMELGDVYFSLLSLANELDVDLSRALAKVLEKYEERTEETGSPGS
ncbi:MAG: MazG nucleotide pyrophosphohydrolase domain-containing protein [Candidatus Nanohaloarchaea archaeon]